MGKNFTILRVTRRSLPKIAETLPARKERRFDAKIELYEVSYLLTRASYNIP